MYYHFGISVPANTLKSAPLIVRLPLDQGTCSIVEINFPPGCAGLVSAVVMYGSIQIIPWNADGALYGDTRTFRLDVNLPVKDPPYEFQVKAWSDDDTYPHVISVGIMVQTKNDQSLLQLLMGG